MRRSLVVVWITLTCGLGTGAALPTIARADSFTCDDRRRVREGQHMSEVLDVCGAPDWQSRRLEKRTYKYKTGRRCDCHHEEITEERELEVLVDEWVYDFGPNRHARHVRFENDVVASIWSRWVAPQQ